VRVLAGGLPLGPAFVAKRGRLAGFVPVQVVIAGAGAVRGVPVADHFPMLPVDEIAFEREFERISGAGALDLALLSVGEDVVSHREIAVDVREIRRAAAAIDQVFLDPNVAAAFIVVNPPAAIFAAADVVNHVEADARAGRDAVGVDAAHVTEHALADVVDIIGLDDVAGGLAGPEFLH
jgi:hypothetical protein